MASALGFSEYNESPKSNNEVNKSTNTKRRRNKTIKNKSSPSAKVKDFLNYMKEMESNESSGLEQMEDGGDTLANFNPPPKPEITKQPPPVEEENIDTHVVPSTYEKIDATATDINQQYQNNYIPYYTATANEGPIHNNKDLLMKKLNNIIYLLEESKGEKTENLTEELILYMFLGVFIIFVVDSFAKVGRYKR